MNNTKQSETDVREYLESSSISDIREWRQSIETFFDEDWTRLNVIIERLEESLWTEENAGEATEQINAAEPQSKCQAQLDALAQSKVPVTSDPEQKRRLEDLAKKIEQRLSHNQGGTEENFEVT